MAQIDLGTDALPDQPAIDLVIGLMDERRELLMQHRLQNPPGLGAEAGGEPALRHRTGQRVRAQHIQRVEFVAVIERRHPVAQIRELPAGLVQQRHRHVRDDDLLVDRGVVDNREFVGAGGIAPRTLRSNLTTGCRLLELLPEGGGPAAGLQRQVHQQIAVDRVMCRRRAGLLGDAVTHPLGQRAGHPGHQPLELLAVESPRLCGQQRGGGCGSHGRGGGEGIDRRNLEK